MCFEINQPTRPGNGRVVGRRVFQTDAQEVAQGEGVRRPPRNTAFGVDALKIANQQQAKVNAWRQARPAHRLGVERRTLRFGETVEPMLAQQAIQSRVERMTRRSREVRRRHPHARLSIALPFAHRHGQSVVRKIDRVDL
jgi:hypothetical protein